MRTQIAKMIQALVLGLLMGSIISAPLASTDTRDPMRVRVGESIAHAELVFKGKVESVGPPPFFESGAFAATQKVTYLVEEVWLGHLPVGEIVVMEQVVVRGSRTAEPGKNELSATLFLKNSVHLVMAVMVHGHFESVDEEYGTLEATPENESLIRKALQERESSL